MTGEIPSIRLNNGVDIPPVGFGVFQLHGRDVVDAVLTAVDTGYRLFDTAAAYNNEEGVGKAIRECGVPREDLFVTTKLRNSLQGFDSTLRAFDASMDRLGLDVVDLYLIHWPVPTMDRYVQSWRALEQLYADGRMRAIGVSNFTTAHLTRLFDETDVRPVLNQIELHPGLPQKELREFHRAHGIATEAWSPLAKGPQLLDQEPVRAIAERTGRSPAQVVLRWHLQLGVIAIPKSANPERIASNFDIFDFELTDDDMTTLTAMEEPGRVGPHPDTFERD